MKKITFLLPAALAFIVAIGAAFSTQAYKNSDSALATVRYELAGDPSTCAICTLNEPGQNFECSTTQETISDPRCTCVASNMTFDATAATDTSVPCAPLWKVSTIN